MLDLKEAKETEYYLASNYLSNRDVAMGIAIAMGRVNNAPTVDAVEVVRCKDCEWFSSLRQDPFLPYCNHIAGLLLAKEETFCSFGKRRDG